MQRILIIGPCGAGKSTFAVALGVKLGLPVHHIDQMNWHPGWVEGGKDALRARLAEVTATSAWIIDGTYGGTLEARLPHADTVLYLDYPIRLCVWRLLKRIAHYHGRARPDMPDGCPERFDLAFLFYLLRWNSGPRIRLEQKIASYSHLVTRFQSPKALDHWLESIAMR